MEHSPCSENVIEEAVQIMKGISDILETATRGFLLPIFIATDGGQKWDEEEGNSRALAAAVIYMSDTRGMSDHQFRNLRVEALLELELIPIIATVSILPEEIGTTKSSCAQAELRALNLAMNMK